MQLDVYSDTICPWCYIGKKRLDRALGLRSDLDIRIRWRPFQLDPGVPRGGIDRDPYLLQRNGSVEAIRENLQTVCAAGRADGILFNYERIQRIPNTLDAHRLIGWAEAARCQDKVVSLVFRMYFEEGADIGDPAVLSRIAEMAGMDPEDVAARLETEEDVEWVLQEDAEARALGINGVPCFLVNRKYALMGAQDTTTLVRVFDRLKTLRAP